LGLGPLTRAELARALGVTKRTASQSALALIDASLVTLRETDSVLMAP
jgi:DNA-binding transcriptional ArsR family regulator